MWIEGRDQFGTICWCHTTSGTISYSHPSPVGLSAVSHPPNSIYRMAFLPLQDLIAEQWEEHTDEKTKKKFWYNKITKESTWDNPKPKGTKPPPPPAPPAPPAPPTTKSKPNETKPNEAKPKEPKKVVEKEREQDLWVKAKDGEGRKVWFNKKTKKSQIARPDCMKKYG